MNTLAQMMTSNELKALHIAKTRKAWSDEPYDSIYYVTVEDERGREKCFTVDAATFDKILEAAGEPGYTEPNYWTYDNVAIVWDDVFPPRMP